MNRRLKASILLVLAGLSGALLYISNSFAMTEEMAMQISVVNPFRAVLAAVITLVTGIIIFLKRNR